jgi:excisionase family DNA binding protein
VTTFLPPNPKDFVTQLLPERRQEPPLLTVRQVAERLGVCTATVYRVCDEGQLPHIRVLHAIRFAPADLASFIRRKRSQR